MKRRAFLASSGGALAACTIPKDTIAPPTTGPSATVPARAAQILASLTLEQKVGQLMSIAFHGTKITQAVEAMIRQRGIGGLVLRAENADDAAGLTRLTADLQAVARDAKVPPLLISIDHEGGPVLRVGKGMTIVPGQMALAATPDPLAAIRLADSIMAAELTAAGVRWNLAPVADVNDEPRNPIIGNRSFGSDAQRVAQLVASSVAAYRAARMFPTAKHFPGHGSTTTDSHTGLPEIDSDRKRLDAVELVPFKAAIAAGAQAIMSAHIVVPALDATPSLPVTLSKKVMTDLLRGELGFQGLIVSDDLEMGALSTIGEARAGLMAVKAGVDHLLFRFDESAQIEGHRLILEALRSGDISAARLDASVQRFIAAKLGQGLYDPSAPPAFDLEQNGRDALELARQSITLLRNDGVLPLRGKVLAIGVIGADIGFLPGDSDLGTELAAMRPNTTARKFAQATDSFIASVVADARTADTIVVGVSDLGTNEDQRRLVTVLAAARPTVLVSLRAPYDALYVSGVAAIVCAYGGRVPTLRALAEVLTGARKPVGKLPVVIPDRFDIGAGKDRLLSLAEPARAAVEKAIGSLCTACVVRVERRGTVDQLSFGTTCPDPEAGADGPCTPESIFDLASLTKLATTAVVLALVRERVIGLDTPFRELIPDFRGGRKDDVTLRHVLTHTAGLQWWLPLWREVTTLEEAVWRAAQEPLAQDLGTFKYSDLGYIMLTQGLANITGRPLDELVRAMVLEPTEARSAKFGPRPRETAVATERDAEWRKKRLRGEVHDENSYAVGGVAGHAGLFGTAADVSAIARVYRDGAVVGNELAHLARTEHAKGDNVRRGLGLALRAPHDAMVGRYMSADTYGHTGFTGTSLWCDPASDLTVILLTNRVYFGRTNDDEMYRFRIAVHEAVSRPFAQATA